MTTRIARSLRLDRALVLTFAPLAYLKLQFFCHTGDTEIGGVGMSAVDDLLYIEDFRTVRQEVTPLSVRFDDGAVADFIDACADEGIPPARCARIWLHTHPGTRRTVTGRVESVSDLSFAGFVCVRCVRGGGVRRTHLRTVHVRRAWSCADSRQLIPAGVLPP